MRRAANTERRPRTYRSPTRDASEAEVHRRIIEAVLRTVARGVTELTVPAVAREASVSVRTVYRHFGSKADLVGSVSAYFGSRSELAKVPLPLTIDDLQDGIRAIFRRLDDVDPALQAVMASEVGSAARRATLPLRLAALRSGLDHAAPGLPEDQKEHLVRLALVLTSSFARRAWKEFLDLDADAAAAEVAWGLRAAIAGVRAT